ncbi:Transcriptional regulatory protein ZraR [Anatilimnocola aggregata]|uniref:DNA-binding transcriptional regulator NtrC n=1 Tax=Anatilimnocola aggregata TaxID=2528021 RepID=A0A517YDN4_9BACT|nr:sigma-54 dependent transcriptional regulator [Anatilimnocola aggregata]QDU28344.1 Transcriptional regulatory protein ZraR [Anatilimnocola aggregata]
MTAQLLVVDDEPNILFSIEHCLKSNDLRVITAGTAVKGIEIVRKERPDAVLLDIRLPDMNGLDAYLEMRRLDASVPIVLMTAFAKTATAIEAMSRGAFDYLIKPVDLANLKTVIAKALTVSRLNRVPAVLPTEHESLEQADQILGRSPQMQEVYKAIGRIAQQDAPVLILGESGTGKELIARAVFHYSRRKDRPFLAMNCAALPETLLESELFGHEKGAFTGADSRRIGKFEQVNGGTLFLDEIGDMSLTTQAKALRLLQEQQFERLGGNATVKTDVRIIAATNQDLPRRVASGLFRLDLYYRLNGFTISLPPLRERATDIPLLTDHFLRQMSTDLNKPVRGVSVEARQVLQEHAWPGNVRELQSAVRYGVLQAAGNTIEVSDLPASLRLIGKRNGLSSGEQPTSYDLSARVRQLLAAGDRDLYRRLQNEFDDVLLKLVWQESGGNQVRMAEILGISRMTLRSKLRACGLLGDDAN